MNSDRGLLLRPELTGPARIDQPAWAVSRLRGTGAILLHFTEPPSADPHARWCGGRAGNPPGYPISPILGD